MFGVCRYASTCVASVLHPWEFFVANLDGRGAAESCVELLTGWVAEVAGIIGDYAAVLTGISHCMPPIAEPYIRNLYI